MNKADVLFLDFYMSIRGTWAGGVVERADMMLRLLPKTTLEKVAKEWFTIHLTEMKTAFTEDRKYFDGRSWSRDAFISYGDLKNHHWFKKEYYEKWSIYEKSSDALEEAFPSCFLSEANYLAFHITPQLLKGEPRYDKLKPDARLSPITERNLKAFLEE